MSGCYITVPLDVIETPRDGEVYADRYWVHMPGEGVLFWNGTSGKGGWSPQCNGDRRLPPTNPNSTYDPIRAYTESDDD